VDINVLVTDVIDARDVYVFVDRFQ